MVVVLGVGVCDGLEGDPWMMVLLIDLIGNICLFYSTSPFD